MLTPLELIDGIAALAPSCRATHTESTPLRTLTNKEPWSSRASLSSRAAASVPRSK